MNPLTSIAATTPVRSRSCRPVRAAGIAAVLVFAWLVARDWHPVYGFIAFLQVGADRDARLIAAFRENPVYLHDTPGSYDGMQYAQIACHPLLRAAELRPAVDDLAYRARRILLPATAWLLAGGRAAWIPQVYASLNIGAWFLLALMLWRILPVVGARGWVAWAGMLFSAGVLGSVRFALTDLPALILVLAALHAAERARPFTAMGWLAAAALTRETSLLAWPGLWRRPRTDRSALLREAGRGLLIATPLLIWLLYVRWQTDRFGVGRQNFGWPVSGLAQEWLATAGALVRGRRPLETGTTLLVLVGLAAQAAFIMARPRPANAWWRVGAVYVLLLLVLGPAVWAGFPLAAARVLLPLNLACNILALRENAPLVWLLTCNLTVFSGLVALGIVPHNRTELAAVRQHGIGCVLHLGPRWYGRETDAHHVWSWTDTRGRINLVVWPRTAQPDVHLTFGLVSPVPRNVAVRLGPRTLWHGAVDSRLHIVDLPVLPLRSNPLSLELSTDTPGVQENSAPGSRTIGFAVYDPVISLSRPPVGSP
jgi:hypothetical protein